MKPVLLIVSLFLPVLAMTQNVYPCGLNWEDTTYDTLPRQSALAGVKSAVLPASIDLSAYCPEVKHQGEAYSCVGWAVGYGALTIQHAIKQGLTDKRQITEQAYSAMFIYNQIKKGHCKQGAQLSDALAFVRKQGDCRARDFDLTLEDCESKPSDLLLQMARKDTILDFVTLFGQADPAHTKIQQVKAALAARRPVVIGMSILTNFFQLRDARYWWPHLGNTTPAGGHAMVVVGYDDQAGAFLLLNSWGKDWGDNGYIRIKYEHFGVYCKYAYVLITNIQEENPSANVQPIAFTCNLQSIDAASEELIWNNVRLSGSDGLYKSDRIWTPGQLFHIDVQLHQPNTYLYIFSVDAQNNIHVHWPRQEALNPKFKAVNESALCLGPETALIIPAPDKALKISHTGKDIMYILLSSKPLVDLKFIMEKMRYTQSDYLDRLERLMGKHLIEKNNILYQSSELAATAIVAENKGYILPVVVELTAVQE